MNKIQKLSEKNKLPLIYTIVALLIPITLILGIIIGKNINENIVFTGDSLSSWVSATATVAIAVLTIVLAKETWYLRDAQIKQLEELRRENIRPNIGIELKRTPVGVNFVDVNIINHGKGIAKYIKFKFVDRNGIQITKDTDVIVKEFCKLAIFERGIQSLGIGQIISSYLFSFIELANRLNKDLFESYFDIVIEFEDVEGTPYKNIFTFDFSQYKGISELGSDPIYSISKNVDELRKLLEIIICKGSRKLNVDIYDSTDRKKLLNSLKQSVTKIHK